MSIKVVIIVVAPVVVIALYVVVVIVAPRDVIVVSVVDYERSMRGLLGYVPHGYDAIVVVNFVVVKFVCVGVYD